MTHTTEHPNAGEIETAPIELAITAALKSMRRTAAEAAARGDDDYYDRWMAAALEMRPTIFVAAALPGEMMAWLIDASAPEGVLETHIAYRYDLPDAAGNRRADYSNFATREVWTRLYDLVADDVSWLVRERSGQPLSAYRHQGPDIE